MTPVPRSNATIRGLPRPGCLVGHVVSSCSVAADVLHAYRVAGTLPCAHKVVGDVGRPHAIRWTCGSGAARGSWWWGRSRCMCCLSTHLWCNFYRFNRGGLVLLFGSTTVSIKQKRKKLFWRLDGRKVLKLTPIKTFRGGWNMGRRGRYWWKDLSGCHPIKEWPTINQWHEQGVPGTNTPSICWINTPYIVFLSLYVLRGSNFVILIKITLTIYQFCDRKSDAAGFVF